MTPDEVLDEFRGADALLEGHFILSSGLHSPVFLQKMRVFQDPARTERLCRALAEAIRQTFGKVDLVVSPAVGGIIPGYERSEEHTSELQSLMRISYAVFCLKKKKKQD